MLDNSDFNRRGFLSFASQGIMSTALVQLLQRDGVLAADATGTSSNATPDRGSQYAYRLPIAKAKRVIQICIRGGLSQVDSFDYKPELDRLHGQALPGEEKPDVFFGQIGRLRKPDWKFRQRGESGLWISDLFPHLAELADELTLIRSMYAETSNHTPATFQENSGFRLNGFPVAGAWVSYGLGSATDDLPAYLVIPDGRGVPAGGSINWTSGFLPAQYQGVVIRSQGEAMDDLQPASPIAARTEVASRKFLAQLNARHLASRSEDHNLFARMRSYELAAKMQLAVPEVANLDAETATTHALYGIDQPETADFGRSCLLARRLVERGVRYVQLFSGGAFGSPRINWDGHEDVRDNHGREALRIDRGVAGLLRDLRQRGLLDETLVLFTTEFGRTPFTQSAANSVGTGRDHNQTGFSIWMAGGGVRGGFSYGSTDDVGWKAVEQRAHWHDVHATLLHLLGINHEELTFYHNGIRRRLTDVSGQVLHGILV